MAEHDFAVVVGVARYFDSDSFPTLGGPINDVAQMVAWLKSETGGGVPEANIRILLTGPDLLTLAYPPPNTIQWESWRPSKTEIQDAVYKLVLDDKKKVIRRPDGRLYLYFSGHGFTSDKEDVRSAALFTADAGGNALSNISGTLCAEALAKLATFGQIVLIMDCCRDVKLTSPYDGLILTDASAPNAEQVSTLAVYAAPKGGKAQEGPLEPGGPTVGFLTHALLKSIREVPPDIFGRISAGALDNYMSLNWSRWFPQDTAPPKPRILQPYSDQAPIFFASGQTLVKQEFSVAADRTSVLEVFLQSPPPNFTLPGIKGVVSGNTVRWGGDKVELQGELPLSDPDTQGRRSFTLHLLPIPYDVYLSDPVGSKLSFTAGSNRVNL